MRIDINVLLRFTKHELQNKESIVLGNKQIHIVGAGLAGSEAAWQVAESGVPVILHEMRPAKTTPVHKSANCAELVCSNSFRSDDPEYNAIGLLHEEMRRCGSLIMREADKTSVPAGGALAVDRDLFSEAVTDALQSHPLITFDNSELTELPPEDWGSVIIATGPLTSEPLAEAIKNTTGEESLSFFDAIAPIIYKDSIDFDICWHQSRYDKGSGKDYINCPFDKDQYLHFLNELRNSEKVEFRDWEKKTPYFEGCMPVEIMASRGEDTLRYGPMKPVGLTDPRTGKRSYAVVQLRQDNALGTLYNIVGFQTKMTYGEQSRVFRLIPGLENARFARHGGIHRNTFINSPRLLEPDLRLRSKPHIRFAGQITGCEGYVESAAAGLLAGRFAASEYTGKNYPSPPQTTAMGSLLAHITEGAESETFQPMNINFGLFPPLEDNVNAKGKKKIKGRDRKKILSDRALKELGQWLETANDAFISDEE